MLIKDSFHLTHFFDATKQQKLQKIFTQSFYRNKQNVSQNNLDTYKYL